MKLRHLILPLMLCVLAACKPAADDAAKPVATPSNQPVVPVTVKPAAIGEVPVLSIDTLDGKTFDLTAQRGKWVVVNYWATWCGPCIKEMPELSALDAMREHIQVIGLAYEDIPADDLRAFLAERPVVYPIAIIGVTNPPASFEAPRGLPLTYLIAPDGKLTRQFVGPVTAKLIEDAIAEAGGPSLGSA